MIGPLPSMLGATVTVDDGWGADTFVLTDTFWMDRKAWLEGTDGYHRPVVTSTAVQVRTTPAALRPRRPVAVKSRHTDPDRVAELKALTAAELLAHCDRLLADPSAMPDHLALELFVRVYQPGLRRPAEGAA